MKVFVVNQHYESVDETSQILIGIFSTKEKSEQAIRLSAQTEGWDLKPMRWRDNYLNVYEVNEVDDNPAHSYTAQEITIDQNIPIKNTAVVTDGYGTSITLMAWVNAKRLYLPLVMRNYGP